MPPKAEILLGGTTDIVRTSNPNETPGYNPFALSVVEEEESTSEE